MARCIEVERLEHVKCYPQNRLFTVINLHVELPSTGRRRMLIRPVTKTRLKREPRRRVGTCQNLINRERPVFVRSDCCASDWGFEVWQRPRIQDESANVICKARQDAIAWKQSSTSAYQFCSRAMGFPVLSMTRNVLQTSESLNCASSSATWIQKVS